MLRKKLRSFSVRTLLLVTTLLCTLLAIWIYRAKEQQRSVQAIRKTGARVRYDYEMSTSSGKVAKPPVWPWFIASLGPDYFCNVAAVTFYPEPPQEADELVKLLDGLPVSHVAIWPGGKGRRTSPAIASGGLTDKGLTHLISEHPNLIHLSLLHARLSPAGVDMLESQRNLAWQIDPNPNNIKRPMGHEPMPASRFSEDDLFAPVRD